MRHDSRDYVGIVLNHKVKAPILIHARLPEIEGLAVLFRAKRGVQQILNQQANLLIESFLDLDRSA
jgi:hypothetical protein